MKLKLFLFCSASSREPFSSPFWTLKNKLRFPNAYSSRLCRFLHCLRVHLRVFPIYSHLEVPPPATHFPDPAALFFFFYASDYLYFQFFLKLLSFHPLAFRSSIKVTVENTSALTQNVRQLRMCWVDTAGFQRREQGARVGKQIRSNWHPCYKPFPR